MPFWVNLWLLFGSLCYLVIVIVFGKTKFLGEVSVGSLNFDFATTTTIMTSLIGGGL